jgi:hypothetical protein
MDGNNQPKTTFLSGDDKALIKKALPKWVKNDDKKKNFIDMMKAIGDIFKTIPECKVRDEYKMTMFKIDCSGSINGGANWPPTPSFKWSRWGAGSEEKGTLSNIIRRIESCFSWSESRHYNFKIVNKFT